MKHIHTLLLFVTLAIAFSSCSKSIDTLEEYYADKGITPQKTANGLAYTIAKPGDDRKITPNDFIRFHFREMNVQGKSGATSYKTGAPINYKVGDLISWLKEGLGQVGVGGDITLYVSPKLIYRVEVLSRFDSEAEFNDKVLSDYISAKGLTATRTSEGLYYLINENGNGRFPSQTSTVTVHYKGYFLDDKQFDSSYDTGKPVKFSLQGVIKGWTLGIPNFDEGSKGVLFIPSNLAYGKTGNRTIPPNSPLIFDIELVDF